MAFGDPIQPVLPGRVPVSGDAGTARDIFDKALGHEFHQSELLHAALTHPSHPSHAAPGVPEYERLEFLGDRVLGLVMAQLLFERFPGEDEGTLSRRHAALVRREALVEVARAIALDRALRTAPGDRSGMALATPSILADAAEAVIAALYLDGGLEVAANFIERHWSALIEVASPPPRDAKTALQEWAQALGKPLPAYSVRTSEGPAHAPVFTVEVRIEGEAPAIGTGASKRAAEQAAAEALLASLKVDRDI